MKSESVALAAHRRQETTTLAWCWKVTRVDGQVFGFTSVDKELVIDEVTYEAATGITPSAVASSADLSVRNLEMSGMLASAAVTEADILAGKWDGAAVEVFEVNYMDLSMGAMILPGGTIGNVSTGRNSFVSEVRGLTQTLQQSVGRVVTAGCQWIFGDSRCKYPVETLRIPFTVDTAEDSRTFTCSEMDEGFTGGVVRWVTGLNAGLEKEIRSVGVSSAGSEVMLVLTMPYPIQAGDTGTAIPGCLKRVTEDCEERWDNVINFGGFPHLPGNDKILGAGALKGGQE